MSRRTIHYKKFVGMFQTVKCAVFSVLLIAMAKNALAQDQYRVVSLESPGIITGTIKWSGPMPRSLSLPITKDKEICDPESRKMRDLERLIVGPNGGVANTVVFLKHISAGKAFSFPETRRFLDQQHCRYEPHILLVPQDAVLQMKSSDATLHTVHMDGAATFNLPFPFVDQVTSRTMHSAGLVNLRCNGGHIWMNAEMLVAPHPYYAVTDESGSFELTNVPPGEYEIVAWHEGWGVVGREAAIDVLTQRRIVRPVFTEPRTWAKKASVGKSETVVLTFVLADK
ncbi:MAG TPA: carboxypeptidase-like regulatory domain-containing protein [Terriglobales bacterium]|nr:carboxypeptidase-like regulatory domain-containing protein [Terriglobales bacterium]